MKNIHILDTEKPSRLQLNVNTKKLILFDNIQSNNESVHLTTQHIYITSDEQPKHNDYYTIDGKKIYYCNTLNPTRNNHYKKIILTTDQDLINDGVQSIGDEYLEWYIWGINYYKTIIPKEEPKQETLEEAAKKYAEGKSSVEVFQEAHIIDFNNGAKWQQENTSIYILDVDNVYAHIENGVVIIEKNDKSKISYSDDEVIKLLIKFNQEFQEVEDVRGWFEQNNRKL